MGIIGVDVLCRRRHVYLLSDCKFLFSNFAQNHDFLTSCCTIAAGRHLWNATGMFFVGWALHYLPFFLMGRSLFLHHYLPALVYAILLFASLFDFALKYARVTTSTRRALMYSFVALTAAIYMYFSPTTYGLALTPAQIGARKWLSTWDYQFGTFFTTLERHTDTDDINLAPNVNA